MLSDMGKAISFYLLRFGLVVLLIRGELMKLGVEHRRVDTDTGNTTTLEIKLQVCKLYVVYCNSSTKRPGIEAVCTWQPAA
jgi:hypothetical protein